MRVLLVLFLAGFALAAASPLYELDQVDGFGELADDLDFFAEENKDDLIQKLKDKFQEVVKKVKDAIDQGKSLKEGLETLEKIRKKLKEFNIDLGDFGNEYLEQLKEKVKDYWKKLKDRLGVSKRNTADDVAGMIQDFKQLINEEYDPEKIKAFVTKHFGENEEFLEDTRKISRDVAEEALDFFREYKKDLGIIFDDIEVKVKDILKQD
ncbi:uncharacterized protein LOC129981193 isoform X2 [Argiope bruennichi]|uniref:uncharacterized protein LOC129981193 isoform X2 n=1 Tax=Argiope bruennichi TaxID=94029 RepID=UPI0024953815|nr:uncharacterized protein LOC129981193 isoform X2 [Argiope bruennichi]